MNQRSKTFQQALALLAHPLSLGAVGLLLANDYLLRSLWPSWLTGKLGDAAWVVFVPFFLAALLAWLVPARLHKVHGRVTFALAFAITGLGFGLVKAVPAAHQVATRIFAAILGTAPSLVFDPTDLLALPFLALPVWLWLRSFSSLPSQRLSFTGWRWLALPLAALVLLADAPAPDRGFACLEVRDGKVYADSGYQSYVSSDGGLNWIFNEPGGAPVQCAENTRFVDGWQQVTGAKTGELYRYRANEEIQLSLDNGATWQTGMKFNAVTEAQRTFILKSGSGNPIYEPGPLDAALDPVTGNMLFAMGQEGVLVHTKTGEWAWSHGGPYTTRETFPNAEAFDVLLGPMIYLAVGLALLVFSTLALRWTKHIARILIVILVWIAFLAIHLIFSPAISTSYALTITSMGMLFVAVLIVPLVIEQGVRLVKRAPQRISLLLAFALGTGILYFVPYLLWLYNILPGFDLANLLALIPVVIFLALGFIVLREKKASLSQS